MQMNRCNITAKEKNLCFEVYHRSWQRENHKNTVNKSRWTYETRTNCTQRGNENMKNNANIMTNVPRNSKTQWKAEPENSRKAVETGRGRRCSLKWATFERYWKTLQKVKCVQTLDDITPMTWRNRVRLDVGYDVTNAAQTETKKRRHGSRNWNRKDV